MSEQLTMVANSGGAVENGIEGLKLKMNYSEGEAMVLAGSDHWLYAKESDQLKLRAARAKAGVKCDGCGRVGYFVRNCPVCGVQYELDRKARFAPTILPRFRRFPKPFSLWASKVMRLTADPKTHELKLRIGMVKIRRHLEADDDPETLTYSERFEDWLGEHAPKLVEGGGRLTPDALGDKLEAFHEWFHRVDVVRKQCGQGLTRRAREKNFFWGHQPNNNGNDGASSVHGGGSSTATNTSAQGSHGPNQVTSPLPPLPPPGGGNSDGAPADPSSPSSASPTAAAAAAASPPTSAWVAPPKPKFGAVIGGKDDYKAIMDPLRKLSAKETMEHYRKSGARGVDNRGVLQLEALHAVKDAEAQMKAAADEQQHAMERARGAGVSSGVKHHEHHHHAESRGALGHAVRGGGDAESGKSHHEDGYDHGVLEPVAKTIHWSDGLLTSFPHDRTGAGAVAPPGHPGGPPLHNMGACADDDPRRWSVDGGESFLRGAAASGAVGAKAAESFQRAPYVPRDGIEANFQGVLRRLATVTKAEISHAVPDAKKAMLAPPKEAAKARFFPDAVFEEDRDYLLSTLEKEGATDMQAHKHKGHYRSSDSAVYFGDRSAPGGGVLGGQQRRGELKTMYEPVQGGLVSSHSSAQWLSVLATNDQHATHGRDATAQARTLSQAFKGQANWVSAQQALVEHRTARCEHLLHLLRTETIADAAREKKLLETQIPRKELRKRHAEAAMERSEAADRIMRVLQEYGILSGDEMADYYMYTINAIKDLPDDDTDHHHHHHGGSEHAGSSKAKSIAASSGDGDQSEYADSRPSSASSTSTVATTVASGATTAANVKQRNKAAAIKKLADDAALKSRIEKASQGGSGASSSTTAPLKAIGTYVPSAESYRPSRAHADASVFEKAGLAQTIRSGKLEEHTTVPALVQYPAAYQVAPNVALATAPPPKYGSRRPAPIPLLPDGSLGTSAPLEAALHFGGTAGVARAGGIAVKAVGEAATIDGRTGRPKRGAVHALNEQSQKAMQSSMKPSHAKSKSNSTGCHERSSGRRGFNSLGLDAPKPLKRAPRPRTDHSSSSSSYGNSGGNDKYSEKGLSGLFPGGEKSWLVGKIMSETHAQMPVDPRTGRTVPYDVYLPTRVSDAPANPPGSRVFSAAMGRALGKFIPNDDAVKFCHPKKQPASASGAAVTSGTNAVTAAVPGDSSSTQSVKPFKSHIGTGNAYMNLFK